MTQDEMAEIIKDQPLSPEERKFLLDAYSTLEFFSQEDKDYLTAAQDARDIMRLQDPYQDVAQTVTEEQEESLTSKQNRDKKALQLHTLKSTVNHFVARQLQNLPMPRLIPETPDKKEVARALQDVLRFIVYDVNNFEKIQKRRLEDFFGPGTAVTQIAWDEDMAFGKGDVALIRWPVESFLWDPQAEDIQDARALIKLSWHPLTWYREHYPDVGKYVQSETESHNEVGIPRSQLTGSSKTEPRAMLMEYWYRTFDGERYHINVAKLAGYTLLERQEDVYEHGLYPFVVDVHSTIEGKPVGDGLVGELAPMMRYINRYAKYMDTNARLNSKGRLFVRKESGINVKDLLDYNKEAIMGDRIQKGLDWDWQAGPPMSGAVFSQMVNFQNELKQDSGANQAARGEAVGNVTSGKAYQTLQQASDSISYMRLETLKDGFKQMMWQVLWLVKEKYTPERFQQIVGNDETGNPITHDYFTAGDQPKYMVQVEISDKSPDRIEAQNQWFMQMFTMAAESQQRFPLLALVQMLNFEGKDDILPIVKKIDAENDQIKALQEQNVQLMDALAKAQKEMTALKQVEAQSINELAGMGKSPMVNKGRRAVTEQPQA